MKNFVKIKPVLAKKLELAFLFEKKQEIHEALAFIAISDVNVSVNDLQKAIFDACLFKNIGAVKEKPAEKSLLALRSEFFKRLRRNDLISSYLSAVKKTKDEVEAKIKGVELIAATDGSLKGNKGVIGVYIITDSKTKIINETLEAKNSYQVEAFGVARVLSELKLYSFNKALIKFDVGESNLLNSNTTESKVVRGLIATTPNVVLFQVPREFNSIADKLAN